MVEDQERLRNDLLILAEMAAEMSSYIRSDVLFWPMSHADMPRLTLGGYLMRQHRLSALHTLLSSADQERLRAAIAQFEAATNEWVVRVEQRGHKELEARLRQWTEYLRDTRSDASAKLPTYYATAAETRAMIAAITAYLQTPPHRLDDQISQKVATLDKQLRPRFQSGSFVWPESWQAAYPRYEYWWLYGTPL